jgi:ribosomal protein L7/L12
MAAEVEGAGVSDEGDGLVDIVVVDPGVRRIPVYDAVRRFTGLNVKQARKLVDAPPQAIITQVPLRQAEALKIELEASGATLELRPAGAPGAPTDLIR